MYSLLLTLHGLNRYVVMATLLLLILNSGIKFFKQQPFSATDNKLSLITLISTHLQLILGLVLYIQSPLVMFNATAIHQSEIIRYYTAEHISMMIIAIVLITLARILAKRRLKQIATISGKPAHSPHKMLLILNLIALIIIIAALGQNEMIL